MHHQSSGWYYPQLVDIASRHGAPIHVLETTRLDSASAELSRALAGLSRPARAYYSVKTNYLPFLCRRLASDGLGADVVSGYELDAALRAGFAAEDIVFNGPVKTEEELAVAVAAGARVHIDGEHEIDLVNQLAAKAGRTAEVGIRISPGKPVSTSVDPSYRWQAELAARRNRFGWPAASPQLAEIVDRISDASNLKLSTVRAHLSSQIVHRQLMIDAIQVVLDEAARLHREWGLSEVNIGGGFGVAGIQRPRQGPLGSLWAVHGGTTPSEPEPTLDLGLLLADVDKRMNEVGLSGVTLSCEPGRWLVSDAMCMLTRVQSVKRLPDAQWLILDAGNHVAPWTGTGEVHRIMPLGRCFSAKREHWSLAGPLCFENDVHGTEVELPADLERGDLICLHDTGAYSLGRSSNFIRTRAAVVATDGHTERTVWRAETGADVFQLADPLDHYMREADSYGIPYSGA